MKDECVISPPTNTGSTTASRAARVHAARQLVAGLSPVWVEASPAALQTAMGNVETAIPVGRPSDWDPETSYMLDAENGLLTLTDQVSVDVDWLFFVIDQTTGESLQWSTAEGNVITLVDLPDDVQDSDSLYIDYRPVSQ